MFKFDRGIIKPVNPFEKTVSNNLESTTIINHPQRNTDAERTGTSSGTGSGMPVNLAGRFPISLPAPEFKKMVEGTVVVAVTGDRDGQVIKANQELKVQLLLMKIYWMRRVLLH